MRVSGAALLAFAFTFCGCLSRPPLNKQTYAFSIRGERVLYIRSLQIASPFDGRSLVYRTGEFSYRGDPYAEFLSSPAELLITPVSGLLCGNGCFNTVVQPGSAVKPDTLVEIAINRLYGDIRKPGNPSAVLAMQVTFLDTTNGLPGRVILQQNYSRQIPISSTAPAALIEGWNQALVAIFAEVTSDFRRQEIEGQRHEYRGSN